MSLTTAVVFTILPTGLVEYEGKNPPDVVIFFCKVVELDRSRDMWTMATFLLLAILYQELVMITLCRDFTRGTFKIVKIATIRWEDLLRLILYVENVPSGLCKGELGCICDVIYDSSMCRVSVELALPCHKHGMRVFEGFAWVSSSFLGSGMFDFLSFYIALIEGNAFLSLPFVCQVYNGLTQHGFGKAHSDYSFGKEQTHVSLHMTAVSSVSGLVGRADSKVNPETGLLVELSGSGETGGHLTTLSHAILTLNWRYYKQDEEGSSLMGWVTFGTLSCIFIVLSSAFCCGGFVYKTRVEHQRGLYALPGMTILAACLETLSESGRGGYPQAENSPFINQTSWDHIPVSTQTTEKPPTRNYGSM